MLIPNHSSMSERTLSGVEVRVYLWIKAVACMELHRTKKTERKSLSLVAWPHINSADLCGETKKTDFS